MVSPCPYLPEAPDSLRAADMKTFGKDRGEDFYHTALRIGQSLWLQGLPAQALLLINRAMGADLKGNESCLEPFPIPYEAAAWIMKSRSEDSFIGNPRRHYQHLATRMVEPRKELRTWRAWACWYLACRIDTDWPSDEIQLKQEGIVEPSFEEIRSGLESLALPGEFNTWQKAISLV